MIVTETVKAISLRTRGNCRELVKIIQKSGPTHRQVRSLRDNRQHGDFMNTVYCGTKFYCKYIEFMWAPSARKTTCCHALE